MTKLLKHLTIPSKHKHNIKAKESYSFYMRKILLRVHKTKTGQTKELHDKYVGRFYIKEMRPFDTYKITDCQTNK